MAARKELSGTSMFTSAYVALQDPYAAAKASSARKESPKDPLGSNEGPLGTAAGGEFKVKAVLEVDASPEVLRPPAARVGAPNIRWMPLATIPR